MDYIVASLPFNEGVASYKIRSPKKKAAQYFSEAYKLLKTILTHKKSTIYTQDAAITINNLGVLQHEGRKYSETEDSYREALGIRKPLAEQEPDPVQDSFLPESNF